MGNQSQHDKDSFVDDVYSQDNQHSKKPTLKTDFKPWHKLRKHYIRKHQWVHEIERLCQKLRFDNGRPLRYLSIPGSDMLDVRYIHSWCKEKQIHLQYLGYNDPEDSIYSDSTELHLSQAELTQREYIDGNSNVVIDKFEKISDEKSIAYVRMIEAGSFDVINLDVCNSIVGHVPLEEQVDYYNAISKIVQHQKNNRLHPWLLFVTTRANRESVDKLAEQKLFNCIAKNAKDHATFNKKLFECLGVNSELDSAHDERKYHRLISLGLGKWILGLLFNNQPKWYLKMLNSIEYKIQADVKSPDMLSLAFECSLVSQPQYDKVGLIKSAQTENGDVKEIEIATCLIDAVRSSRNVDGLLNGEPVLCQALMNEAAVLMRDARYDEKEFKKWAMNNLHGRR